MHHLRPLAEEALTELRTNPPANSKLPKTRKFAEAFNAEISKPGAFDPSPWIPIARASGEEFTGKGDLHFWLWGIGGQASLLAVPLQQQLDQSKLVANVRRVCEALASM